MKPIFFARPADFRTWLEQNHATAEEVLVGFYKKGSGKASIDWPQAVDEALCFGWIAGIRRRIDEESHSNRVRPPWYRRTATRWVISAKREETRERRLEQLIADSAAGRLIRAIPQSRP